jgi:DNA-binding NarL/FixJ family response regulator
MDRTHYPEAGEARDDVLIVDKIDLVRIGLRSILGEQGSQAPIVHDADSVTMMEQMLHTLEPRLGLLIVGNITPSEMERMVHLRRQLSCVPKCLLIEDFDEAIVEFGQALDVLGFLQLSASPREVVEAVSCMLAGRVYLPRTVRPYLHQHVYCRPPRRAAVKGARPRKAEQG